MREGIRKRGLMKGETYVFQFGVQSSGTWCTILALLQSQSRGPTERRILGVSLQWNVREWIHEGRVQGRKGEKKRTCSFFRLLRNMGES